jgi:hypothetical protein
MFADARIKSALETLIDDIAAPPAPLAEIQRLISLPHPRVSRRPRYTRVAMAFAAAIVLAIVALPAISPALVQTIEARYRAALQALGGTAPPPAPKSLVSSLTSQRATLETAQSRVSFTIVPPAGLPAGIESAKILTTPTGVYSKATHSWRVGSPAVTFSYHRSGGRSFILMADRFDPKNGPPPKYLFEALDPTPDGRPVIVKHENFAWRNGDQIMTAVEGEGVSAAEIETIRGAMHGIALPGRNLHAPSVGTQSKLYRITRP